MTHSRFSNFVRREVYGEGEPELTAEWKTRLSKHHFSLVVFALRKTSSPRILSSREETGNRGLPRQKIRTDSKRKGGEW